MRAVRIDRWCEPRELLVGTAPDPVCGPGQVRIGMRAAPVTFALSLLVAGRYQRKPAFPFVPGNTIAGEILELGADTGHRLRVGQRVLASMEFGSLAEQAVAEEANVYPIPDAMSFAHATALNTSYNSVLAALTWPRLLDIQAGETLLVTGAAGGVGLATIEIARALGARVVASASTPAKRDAAIASGADHAVEAGPDQLRDAVLAFTDGEGVNAVLDPVGGEVFLQAMRCLRPEGRILPIGFASGTIPQIPANLVLVKNVSVLGLYMGYYKIDARERYGRRVQAVFARLCDMYLAGQIRPRLAGTHPLDDVCAAFDQVLQRDTIGHVVVTNR